MKRKYDEASVIRALAKKGVVVNTFNKSINIENAHDLGNGSWGKIDYLRNHCNYSIGGVKIVVEAIPVPVINPTSKKQEKTNKRLLKDIKIKRIKIKSMI